VYAYQLGGVRVSFRGCTNSGDHKYIALLIKYTIIMVRNRKSNSIDFVPYPLHR